MVTAEDYSRLTGRDVELAPDEVLACPRNLGDFPEAFTITTRFGQEGLPFRVRETVTETIRHGSATLLMAEEAGLFLVVSDRETAEKIMDLDARRGASQFRVQMNLAGETYQEKLDQTQAILARLSRGEDGIDFVSKQENAQDFYAMYGGFLFLGSFLGVLFLLATVLIIYYKQISEGYEDQRRYQLMRQVGMSRREVRASIHSQILLVFFLPLLAAGLHILAAFPMLSKMMELFNLYDTTLFAACSAGTLLVFCLIYALVYGLTAHAYDRIVGN